MFVKNCLSLTLATVLGVAANVCVAASEKGPSSSDTPYVVMTEPGWDVISLLTVGDRVPRQGGKAGETYRMVGTPDGLGAFDNGDGTFTVLMNHEIAEHKGVVRAHGAKGAFVSRWVIRKNDLSVTGGSDLIREVNIWQDGQYLNPLKPKTGGAVTLSRFCSADLSPRSAFFNKASGKGFNGLIFMNGEEKGPEGRAFAHIASGPNTGVSWQLPRLGKFSWENAVAHPASGDLTLVFGTDDATPGQVYLYVGEKQKKGNEIERAGLTNGRLFGIKVSGIARTSRDEEIQDRTAFALADLGDVSNLTGAQLQRASIDAGVTEFLRPEDAAWDTRNPNVLYFVTTDRFDSSKISAGSDKARTRLYKLEFFDVRKPQEGGLIYTLIDGSDPRIQMFDNITVNGEGHILIQEDPGNQFYNAKTWLYDADARKLTQIAMSDPQRFGDVGADSVVTPGDDRIKPANTEGVNFSRDEENSGVIEITELLKGSKRYEAGRRYYLAVNQAHFKSNDEELVEGGQMYLMVGPTPK